MAISETTKKHLASVAEPTLAVFEQISDAAQAARSEQRGRVAESLAQVNTFTSTAEVQNLSKIHQQNDESYEKLHREPAIARVVATDSHGQSRVYYICRTNPVITLKGGVSLASYLAPVGRLASLRLGEDVALPSHEVLTVVERAVLRPFMAKAGWDSRNSVMEGGRYGPLTIESLRALLLESPDVAEDILERLLNEEDQSTNVRDGIRRAVLTRMELRDQPVLDRFQDEIFRLPLDTRLLLLGPPGTGKTTTLIRRLGQKLDPAFLSEDERSLVDDLESTTRHADSWLMFTPTSLLRQYVKESFARERVPASDRNVRTWVECRRDLARNAFGLLRTATRRSGFVLRDTVDYLSTETVQDLTGWFDDFHGWQYQQFVDHLSRGASELASTTDDRLASLGAALLSALATDRPGDVARLFRQLQSLSGEMTELTADLTTAIDGFIRRALVRQVNRNEDFLTDLAAFLNTLDDRDSADPEEDEGDLEDEEEDEEDEGDATSRTNARVAQATFRRALLADARAAATGRPLRPGTRSEQVTRWIGDRGLRSEDRLEVGRMAITRRRARPFVNPVRLYLTSLPMRYRRYRRARGGRNQWYGPSPGSADISPLELDMLLLAILRYAGELLDPRLAQQGVTGTFWTPLQNVLDAYRTQILVDEATDFSPIQLACMAALAHPSTRSFFACGDFNQRLTQWGTRSMSEVKWADPTLRIEKVTIGYRQSGELNALARQLALASGDDDPEVVLPGYAERHGVRPILAEHVPTVLALAAWLAGRIVEIERAVGQLPTIAILVPHEGRVEPVAAALDHALAGQNVNVLACPNGQVIGQENDIRVFDAQHIKGLEFEAVFFCDVDDLIDRFPDLFSKFLYVGATRAATYFGLTCTVAIPSAISGFRHMFGTEWHHGKP